jgi:hypothetical protein
MEKISNKKCPKFQKYFTAFKWNCEDLLHKYEKKVNLDTQFYDPHKSWIEKIFAQNGLKFLDLCASIYGSSEEHKVTWLLHILIYSLGLKLTRPSNKSKL